MQAPAGASRIFQIVRSKSFGYTGLLKGRHVFAAHNGLIGGMFTGRWGGSGQFKAGYGSKMGREFE
jgi:hypothetical protein